MCVSVWQVVSKFYSILYEGPQTFGRRIVLGGLIRLHNLQALFQHRPNSISKMIGDFRIHASVEKTGEWQYIYYVLVNSIHVILGRVRNGINSLVNLCRSTSTLPLFLSLYLCIYFSVLINLNEIN